MEALKESVVWDTLNRSHEMEMILQRDERVLVAMRKQRMEMEALI